MEDTKYYMYFYFIDVPNSNVFIIKHFIVTSHFVRKRDHNS